MTTNTAIITKGIAPAPAGAPPAACAMASGINEFMELSHRSQKNCAARAARGAYFGRKPDLCHRDLRGLGRGRAGVPGISANYLRQLAALDTLAQVAHELQVVVQVVDGIEP